MNTNLRLFLLDYLRRSHKKRWAKLAAMGCEKYLRAYYNEGHWDMKRNGEAFLMRQFATLSARSPALILDVGSHEGEWAEQFLGIRPESEIICFEILPQIRERLKARFPHDKRVRIAECGLSHRSGSVDVTWNKTHDTTNAIHPTLDGVYFSQSALECVTCGVQTGDDFIDSAKITRVDFLKIDTEGHEVSVLRGFSRLLYGQDAPRVIQFEYGTTWLAERTRLSDLFELLRPAGYAIGRLYPKGADFKDFELSDENFRMCNYVAVKQDDPLLQSLKLQ